VVILIATLFVARKISLPLIETSQMLKDIAKGDLTMRLNATSKDETGEMALWFNTFIEKLQGIIKQIAENSTSVASASEEMSANLDSVATAMEQSSTNTDMVATAAEEISATINEIAENAERGIRCE
jgi:methyl-accepting chemotaxis protein